MYDHDVPDPCLCGDPCCRRCFPKHQGCEECGEYDLESDPDDENDRRAER